ncbi:hypothetical protein DSO57_1001619 [Entomophthora muscae]|uniref:Uncharacterized protein n=1 Tax=Entomophthora muscae TaxID=34485 RepID=A0ACC2S023_9FUNG|nr:hypothetical protein DSO57_1001619 [Entomophthora muscae]
MSPLATSLVCERPDSIQEMISGVERYNPDNLPFLEEYLGAQCKKGQYDILANTAILELYQFNPTLINMTVVTTILGKALTALPDADFNMFLSLLSSSVASESTVCALVKLQEKLEECRYEEFWALRSNPTFAEVLADIEGFDDAIRGVITHSLLISFQSLPKDIAIKYLNLKDKALEAYASTLGWVITDCDVKISNTPLVAESKPGLIRQQILLEQVTQLISQSARQEKMI